MLSFLLYLVYGILLQGSYLHFHSRDYYFLLLIHLCTNRHSFILRIIALHYFHIFSGSDCSVVAVCSLSVGQYSLVCSTVVNTQVTIFHRPQQCILHSLPGPVVSNCSEHTSHHVPQATAVHPPFPAWTCSQDLSATRRGGDNCSFLNTNLFLFTLCLKTTDCFAGISSCQPQKALSSLQSKPEGQ